jgi:exonuclease VII small subunit
MLMRLRAFCAAHTEIFDSVTDFRTTLAELEAAIAELDAHRQAQDSGLASFHEAVLIRAAARAALRRTLESIRAFAKTLGTVGLDEVFGLRRKLRDAELLVRAGSIAVAAAPMADRLVARGLAATALPELPTQMAALEDAIEARTQQRRVHVNARAGFQAALKTATQVVKRLDAMVLYGPPRDAATIAGWRNIRRVGPSEAAEPPAAELSSGPELAAVQPGLYEADRATRRWDRPDDRRHPPGAQDDRSADLPSRSHGNRARAAGSRVAWRPRARADGASEPRRHQEPAQAGDGPA